MRGVWLGRLERRQKGEDGLSRAGSIVLALLRSDNIYRSEDTLIPRMFSLKDALSLCASSTLELGTRTGKPPDAHRATQQRQTRTYAEISNSSHYQLPLFALSVQNNGALSTVPFTATARLLQIVVLKKRNTKKEQNKRGGGPPRNAQKGDPPSNAARHKKKERQAFHVPSSRSAPFSPSFPTRHHHPLFFSLVPVASPPLLLPRSQYPECAALATIDIPPLSFRVLSPSQLLLEPLRHTPPSPREQMQPKARKKTQPRKTKAKQRRAAPCPKFQYALFAPAAATSHERLVDKSRLSRTGIRGGPPPPPGE